MGKKGSELVEALNNAEAVLRKAQERYARAYAQAADTEFSSDGTAGLRIAAREYRHALQALRKALDEWSKFTSSPEPPSTQI